MTKINPIFPESVNNEYKGYSIARYVFVVIIVITIFRSCIHLLAPDGGAGVIAGLDTSGEQGQNLIGIFSLWGFSQLLLGFFFIIVYLRYKSLISFCYLLLIIEWTGRMIISIFKPLIITYTPPGAIGNLIFVPLSIIMFILSIIMPKKLQASIASR